MLYARNIWKETKIRTITKQASGIIEEQLTILNLVKCYGEGSDVSAFDQRDIKRQLNTLKKVKA